MRSRVNPSRFAFLAVVPRAAGALALRLLARFVRRPVDSVAILCAAAACGVILVNAVFLQSGSHPAPFFANPGAKPTAPARPKPTLMARPLAQIVADIQLELMRRGFYDGPVDGTYTAKIDAAIRDFTRRADLKMVPDPTEALLAAIAKSPVRMAQGTARPAPPRSDPIADLIGPSPRIMALQRALADFGYGQIKPSGTMDAQTNAAIEKFEREHRMPVTGQVSDRVVRELAAMTGRPLE